MAVESKSIHKYYSSKWQASLYCCVYMSKGVISISLLDWLLLKADKDLVDLGE